MSVFTEQLRITVGDRERSEARTVSEVVAGFGASLAGSSLTGVIAAGLLAPPPSGAVRTGLQWNAPSAVTNRDLVHTESVVTRVEQSPDGAVFDRNLRLLDDRGSVREEGLETWQLPKQSEIAFDVTTDFCTPAWGELLRESLSVDADFGGSLSTWDGTVGLCCRDGSGSAREVQLRIYRGLVIDVARRVPGGATFTLIAPAVTWVDLVFSEHDDFMRRAIRGEFSSSGDGYEYLRLTKPLAAIFAHARALVGARQGAPQRTSPRPYEGEGRS